MIAAFQFVVPVDVMDKLAVSTVSFDRDSVVGPSLLAGGSPMVINC